MILRTFWVWILILVLTACQAGTPELAPPTDAPLPAPLMVTTVNDPAALPDTPVPTLTEPAPLNTKPAPPVTPLPRLSAGVKLKINQLQMFPDGSGWALGGAADQADLPSRVLRTQDNARTWYDLTPPEPAPVPGSPEKTAIAFFSDSLHAWVTFGPPDPMDEAHQPVVWRTSDGGVTWQSSQVIQEARFDTVYAPSNLFFSDAQHGWLMSHHGAAAGHTPVSIFMTTDGGQTWSIVARPMDAASFPLHTCCQSGLVFFEDSQTGLVARDGGPIPLPHVLRTTDGGVTWQQMDFPEPSAGLYTNHYCTTGSLQRLSGTSATLVMNCMDFEPGGAHRAYLYTTDDSGATWDGQPLPEPVWPPEWRNVNSSSTVQWLTANTHWLFTTAYYELPDSTTGYNATSIYLTRDGGISWESQGLTYWRGEFLFTSLTEGFAIARADLETALVYSQNSGLQWSMLDPILVK